MTNESRIDCATANAALERLSALERIRWAADTLSDQVVLLSSMQKTGVRPLERSSIGRAAWPGTRKTRGYAHEPSACF